MFNWTTNKKQKKPQVSLDKVISLKDLFRKKLETKPA